MKNFSLIFASSLILIATHFACATIPTIARHHQLAECQLGQTCDIPAEKLGFITYPIAPGGKLDHSYECLIEADGAEHYIIVEAHNTGDVTFSPQAVGTSSIDFIHIDDAVFNDLEAKGAINIFNTNGATGAKVTCQQMESPRGK